MGKKTRKPCFSNRERGFMLFAVASTQPLAFDRTEKPVKARI
jgi:hypothetical protein